MSPEIDTLKVALRVMAAIAEKQTPDSKDVELLRQVAPKMADEPVAELAFHVIRVSRGPLSVNCQKCERLANDVAYAQRVHEKSLARMTESMSGQYETYVGFRNAETLAARELELARQRLNEHKRSHRA
jgi:hypothetical protein